MAKDTQGLEFATERRSLPLVLRTPAIAAVLCAALTALGGLAIASSARAETVQMPLPRLAPDNAGTNGAPVLSAASGGAKAAPAAASDSGDADDSGDATDGTDDIGAGSGDDLDSVPADTAPDQPDVGPPSDIRPGSFTLEARLAPKAPPLGDGVKWRIFGDTPGPDGHLQLLGEADGGIVYFGLNPGTYYVHAAYGRAGATRKIAVNGRTGGEVVVLNAGGMRLAATNAKDQPLHQGEVTFDIYAPDEAGDEGRFLLVPNAPPGHIISLNAGTYHVVSKYGDANAIVRTDIKVDPGKLTEATVFLKAARMTLKLVEQHGGEAIADTAWTVTTNGGSASIAKNVGAFPTVILAAGDYTAIAKHDGKTFQKNFSVEPGSDRDVEVLAQ
ncbi:MAG TPA: hypothetical protein VHA70_10975 [Bauldia sp.]|nr:hypothetical protein [Bauldia sp.]